MTCIIVHPVVVGALISRGEDGSKMAQLAPVGGASHDGSSVSAVALLATSYYAIMSSD